MCAHTPNKLFDIKDLRVYTTAWDAWWDSLQPSWRKVEDEDNEDGGPTLSQAVNGHDIETWNLLCRGGKNGVFMPVLVSLVILWAQGESEHAQSWDNERFKNAIEDVNWALLQIVSGLPRSSHTDHTVGRPQSKRYVILPLKKLQVNSF